MRIIPIGLLFSALTLLGLPEPTAHADTVCTVATPPARLGLNPFYSKYCSADGMPVIAAAVVPDLAVQQTGRIVAAMLAPMPAVRNAIVSFHGRYGIIGEYQTVTDMPEREHQAGVPGRGYGASTAEPLAVTGEENIMCYEATNGNAGENIVVHEMAHTIMNGYALVDPTLHAKVAAAYASAIAAGKYKGLYAGTNADEYWAEGVQDYLNAHATWNPKDINDRAALAGYDPTLYSIIDGVFADVRLPPLCPAPIFSSTTWYRLSSEAFGGKSLDVDQMKPSGNFSGQYWHLHPLDGDRFRLTNMYNGELTALDTANDGVYEVQMSPVGTQSGQRWSIHFYDNGVYRLTNDFRGTGSALDAEPDGTRVQVDETDIYSNQLWTITPIGP